MTLHNRVLVQIKRVGREAGVKPRSAGSENKFGNTKSNYPDSPTRYVAAMRSYPNRNTQMRENTGDKNKDKPIFFIPTQDGQPDPPEPDDRIVYDGTEYEVMAHTEYDTHVEFFGRKIEH